MSETAQTRRIAIFSRYNLAEQYDLAAEFEGMLKDLAAQSHVLHLSFRGPRKTFSIPANLRVEELPLHIDRRSPRDVLIKSILMYLYLPAAVVRLRRFKPDVIFLSEILPMVGLFMKWFTGSNVATAYGDWHFHNFFGGKAWGRRLLKIVEALDRFEARRLTGFFCRAAAAGERVQHWGVPADHVRVVRDAPDPNAFYPRDGRDLRHRCGFKDEDVVLLYHGVMHSGKGIDKLMDWTNELYMENPAIGLILVGGGPEQATLRERARTLDMGSRIFFTGWLKTIREIGDYCNAADLCVAMRTKSEANDHVVPGALLHSMACRKVVIGPRLSGIAEIIRDGVNGFLFTADDGEDFKRLIRTLIRTWGDWAGVSERAYRDILDHYSVHAAAKQYAQALKHFAEI